MHECQIAAMRECLNKIQRIIQDNTSNMKHETWKLSSEPETLNFKL